MSILKQVSQHLVGDDDVKSIFGNAQMLEIGIVVEKCFVPWMQFVLTNLQNCLLTCFFVYLKQTIKRYLCSKSTFKRLDSINGPFTSNHNVLYYFICILNLHCYHYRWVRYDITLFYERYWQDTNIRVKRWSNTNMLLNMIRSFMQRVKKY